MLKIIKRNENAVFVKNAENVVFPIFLIKYVFFSNFLNMEGLYA
jgi:hypothetical protein